MKKTKFLKPLIFLSLLFIGFSNASAQAQDVELSSETEIQVDLAADVCRKNGERLEAVKKMFGKMGANADEIKTEKFKDAENVVVTVKGKTDETIVVGAHFDKTLVGCGVIDNWTGVVILAHLFRTMRQFETEKTYIFVAFGEEESGLVGSARMAKAIPKERRASYCAMLNLDSFGLSYPQAMTNISDGKLMELAESVSKDLKIPFAKAAIANASSDSASFREQKIPAITIHGMNDKWQQLLHGSGDKLENVNAKAVYIGYRFGLNFLAKLDASGCGDFRK
jgi:Zn-dependent M28 family amino/carboxypeptidase